MRPHPWGAEYWVKQFNELCASTLAFQLLKIDKPDGLVKSLHIKI